jgi:hypothetical protein
LAVTQGDTVNGAILPEDALFFPVQCAVAKHGSAQSTHREGAACAEHLRTIQTWPSQVVDRDCWVVALSKPATISDARTLVLHSTELAVPSRLSWISIRMDAGWYSSLDTSRSLEIILRQSAQLPMTAVGAAEATSSS